MYKYLLFLILFIVTEDIYSQHKYPQNLYFNRLTINEGLSQSANSFIYKDSKNFVWLSSTSGLNRFDGYNVKIYRESSQNPSSIKGANINGLFCEDANGDLWFSTYSAINHYLRKEDRFEHFNIEDSSGQKISGYFTSGLSTKGILWVVHKQSLYKFDTIKKTFEYVTGLKKPYQKSKAVFNPDGSIKYLFAYYHDSIDGVERIEFDRNEKPNSETFLTRTDHNNSSSFIIREIDFESDSLCWMTTNHGIITFNNQNKKIESYKVLKDGKEVNPKGLANFNEKYLFLSTNSDGLILFDKLLKKPVRFYTAQESKLNYNIISNGIGTTYIDQDQGIWLDIPGISVEYSFPRKQKFNHYLNFEDIGSIPTLRSLISLPGDTTFWAGSFNDRNLIFNKDFEILDIFSGTTNDELKGNPGFYHFIDQENRVWHCGWGGLVYYDLDKRKFVRIAGENSYPLPAMIFGFSLDNGNVIFSAVTGGLYKLISDAAGNQFLQKINDKGYDGAYPIVYKSKDKDYYASENLSHLIKFDQELNRLSSYPLNADIRAFYEFPNDSILWMGSNQGLIAFNKKQNTFRIFSEKDGLPNALIFGLVGENKNLWLSTANGIAKFNTVDSTISSYSAFDGIAYPEFNAHSFLKKKDGQILFGSLLGITAFYPEDIKPTPYNSHPQITEIKINDEVPTNLFCKKTQASNPSEVKSLQLPYSENTLSFEFSAMDYGDPKNNQYKYRLLKEQQGSPWIESGTRNFARFANITAGRHQFQLLAANSDGHWNDTPLTLDIYIVPPLIQRTWFRILLVAIFAGLLWLASRIYYNFKFGKQIALERQKLFWARKMHEDLGADYSSLKIRLGLFIDQLGGNAASAKDTQRIKELSETVGKQIRGITWSLNYKNDTLDKLCNYLREYAAKRFEDTGIDLYFQIPDEVPELKISGENRMTILHVFKEALNNIHKSAEAQNVQIRIQVNATSASILIQDNGKGFDPALLLQSTGDGLNNMRERMDEIGGKCTIQTNSKGTIVELNFPL